MGNAIIFRLGRNAISNYVSGNPHFLQVGTIKFPIGFRECFGFSCGIVRPAKIDAGGCGSRSALVRRASLAHHPEPVEGRLGFPIPLEIRAPRFLRRTQNLYQVAPSGSRENTPETRKMDRENSGDFPGKHPGIFKSFSFIAGLWI